MVQPSSSELTPLVGRPPAPASTHAHAHAHAPAYGFKEIYARLRRERRRKIQFCICSTFLLMLAMSLIITMSYTMKDPDLVMESNNGIGTTGNLTDGTLSMGTLLLLAWPRQDAAISTWTANNWSGSELLDAELRAAGAAGGAALWARQRFEAATMSRADGAGMLAPGSAAHKAQRAMAAAPPSAPLAAAGFAKDYATKFFVKNKTHRANWCIGRGPTIDASWSLPECKKPQSTMCSRTKYRSINGTCNNLEHTDDWGVAFTLYRRAMPPDYADGVSSPRVGQDGLELPSARQVSIHVHRPVYRADLDFNMVLAVWGQFLDHDITSTAINQGPNGSAISCCSTYKVPGLKSHPECYPVPIGPGDPNYEMYNLTCIEFVRSAPAPSCFLGPREHMNQASAFIDGSAIYGPYEELAKSLRTFEGGELLMMKTADGRELLPASKDPNDGCNKKAHNTQGKYCFLSGDLRTNENLQLTTMQLLWVRQHNRLARTLRGLNPHWGDQLLYDEARAIVAAQIQHITYNEFLPVLFGKELMEKLELSPKEEGYYKGYNATMEPNIANNFASAAFRFAHSLFPTKIKVVNSQTNSPEYVYLHKMLFNPYSLYSEGGVDNAIRGAMQTDVQKVDSFFTPELTTHLFKTDSHASAPAAQKQVSSAFFGLDLVSLNIQRGRDHGLPGYPAWRQHCGLSRPSSWEDLEGILDPDSLQRISSIFKSVEDVDLYTAALSEVPLRGRILGATITCLLADQFLRLKRADRFWYETNEQPQAFSKAKLQEIRKTTLAGIICQNADSLATVQMFAMRTEGPDNSVLRCSAIPDPDLTPWMETPTRISLVGAR